MFRHLFISFDNWRMYMPRGQILKAGGGNPNQIPKEWRQHAKSPFPKLKNYWFKQYVLQHPGEFEFSNLEEAPNRGVDFRGDYGGKSKLIKIARDYLLYLSSDHPNCDVMVVGVLEPPIPDMLPHLPEVIINLDPQKVIDWSKEARLAYRNKMDERRERLPEQWAFVDEHKGEIKETRLVNEQLDVRYRDQHVCECGGVMLESGYDPELDGTMTEGQEATYMAGLMSGGGGGFSKPFECRECGERRWIEY